MTRVAYFTNHAVTRIKYQSTNSSLFLFFIYCLVAFCKTIYTSCIAKLTSRLVCWHHLSKESTAATTTFGLVFSRTHSIRKEIFFFFFNFLSLKLWIILEFPFPPFSLSLPFFQSFIFLVFKHLMLCFKRDECCGFNDTWIEINTLNHNINIWCL